MESLIYEGKKYSRNEFVEFLQGIRKNIGSDLRIKSTMNYIDFREGTRILDIGCNIGTWAKYIAGRGEGKVTVYAIDIVEDFIKIAEEFNSDENVKFLYLDLLNNNFPDNNFDQVIFLETIEHVENPVGFLREIHRILKPGGSLIISTPNSLAIFRTIKNILFSNPKKREALFKEIEVEERNTGTQKDHMFLWDYECFFRLLNRTGFLYKDHVIVIGRFIHSKLLDRIVGNFAVTQIFKVLKPITIEEGIAK